MQIFFGMAFDSSSYQPQTSDRQAVMGELYCGPLGLLQLLETRLGLAGNWEAEPYRIEIYRQRLLSADNGGRFYSRSLKADAQAVAQTLLSWRDELLLSGWDFTAAKNAPARLRDLVEVEAVLVGKTPAVPYGFAERFRAVMAALPAGGLDISSIRMAEPKSLLGEPWNALFTRIAASGVVIVEENPLSGTASGDLGQVQKALATNTRVTASGDGSLLVLRSASDSMAADLLSALLAVSGSSGRLFIIPRGDRTLERVLLASGMPAQGISSYSSLRPILQILPLLCELLWEPLDPYRLLEFLSLPETPLPRWIARRLAEAVAAAPGIGGKAWHSAMSVIETIILKDNADGEAKCRFARKNISSWLETRRYPLAGGVPQEAVVELAKRIAQWAGSRQEEDLSQLKALAAQAGHLARLVEAAPERTIRQPQLRRLLRLVLGEGQSLGELAEVGHQSWIGTPDAVREPAAEIFWWGFTSGHAAGYRRSPWLRSEVEFLTAAGVILTGPELELRRHVRGYERGVLGAGKRLVLVIPDRELGAEAAPHPLYDRLKVILGESLRSIECSAVEWLTGNDRLPPVTTAMVLPRKVPVPARQWQLPSNIKLPPQAKESYSSLEVLFDSPYRWVLNYEAALREGVIQSIGSQSSIMGTLSHRLFEELFVTGERCRTWTQASVDKNVEALLTALLATEGCVFLLPDHLSERMMLMKKLKRAAWSMTEHIRDNGWQVAGTEYAVSGSLGVQSVVGTVDLLLEKKAGTVAVVDLKWGKSQYLRNNLLKNRADQLALYAHMLQVGKKMPHVAYFSFSEAVMVAPDHKAFKGARLAELPVGESLATLIQRMEQSYQFRWAQLEQGNVEVTVAGTVANPAVVIPPDCLIDPEKTTGPEEFRTLVGWEEGNRA